MQLSDSFSEVIGRDIPKLPTLRGKTLAIVFAEDSTRTRTSFEIAAKRLSMDVLTLNASQSSLKKGETLRDTLKNLYAIGADAFAIRHSSAGVPAQAARWLPVPVINAGDGCHEHPTQALLDCYTIRQHFAPAIGTGQSGEPVSSRQYTRNRAARTKRDSSRSNASISSGAAQTGLECFKNLRVAIVGDIEHSRVARSLVAALDILGARTVLVAPKTLLPRSHARWPSEISTSLDEVLPSVDVCYILRLQRERGTGMYVPTLREYYSYYGIDERRYTMLPDHAVIMHPGPLNRGVEIDSTVADSAKSLILHQATSGVAVRMAVLYLLLGHNTGIWKADGRSVGTFPPDATGHDATGHDATGQDTTGQDSAGQDSAGRNDTGHDATTELAPQIDLPEAADA
ncbi:MAG: aspartate carbamoyltransferase catalytic subunit [Actinobacteria bacterium]|nr:aspartate carbamoyltransferase catalytic subunit [Actinomycetota bacterium]